MRILRNRDLVTVVAGRSDFLKALLQKRAEADPTGWATEDAIEQVVLATQTAGLHQDAKFLRNLVQMHKSGQLARVLGGKDTWPEHVAQVHMLKAQEKIPFMINDFVLEKETGKFGQVMDYLTDEKKYIVALDPFQIKTMEAKELIQGKGP